MTCGITRGRDGTEAWAAAALIAIGRVTAVLTMRTAAAAKDVPEAEWFPGYNYIRIHSATSARQTALLLRDQSQGISTPVPQCSFDPSDNSEQRNTVRLEARIRDEKRGPTAETTATVKNKAATAAVRLPDIVFPAGNARINNCNKRVLLEEWKSFIERDPSGNVVLVGHISGDETAAAHLDEQRALTAAAVISAGEGICNSFPATQILVGNLGAADNSVEYKPQFCGTSSVPQNLQPGSAAWRSGSCRQL